MKKFNLLIAAITFTLVGSSSIAQQTENVWVTFENEADVPTLSNGKLRSSNPVVQQLIDENNIIRVDQAVPNSRRAHLQKVYEMECNCDANNLSYEIQVNAEEILTRPEIGPQYQLLNDPDDYNTQFQQDYALDLIRAKDAWNYSTGDTNTIIGISDGNYYLQHEDLQGQFYHVDYTNGSQYYAHGTAVALTAAGATDNALGKSAIGYNCRMHLVGMNYNNVIAMSYAGARVINLSWTSGCWDNWYVQEVINEVYDNGSIVVASAGNGGTCGGPTALVYPAACDHVIAVSSIGPNDNHERFPGDPTSTHQHNASVDIVAPGYDVALSVMPGMYITGNGTSFAAPYVSGTIGLMLSIRPCLTFEEVMDILTYSATNIDAQNPAYVGQLGVGRLDAGKALTETIGYVCDGDDPIVTGDDIPNNPEPTTPTVSTNDDIRWKENKYTFEQSPVVNARTASTEEMIQNSIRMYPNPTAQTATVRWDADQSLTLKVVDMNGAVVYQEELGAQRREATIDIKEKGIYFIRLESEGHQYWSGKLVRI